MNLEAVMNRLEGARAQLMLGWTTGALYNQQGEMCAVGAVQYGTGEVTIDDYFVSGHSAYDLPHPRSVASTDVAQDCLLVLHDALEEGQHGYHNYPGPYNTYKVYDAQRCVVAFNNTRDNAGPVIDLFDKAIMNLKQQMADALVDA